MTRPLGRGEARRLLGALLAGALAPRRGGEAAPAAPVTGDRAERVLLGMPQLGLGGLSENWLLKDCGHRHWMALAAAAGRDSPDFTDDDGRPVYAAFNAVSVAGDLSLARENDVATVTSRLVRVSRTQFMSRQIFSIDGATLATVEMCSVFVRRTEAGRNRSIARFEPPGLAAIGIGPDAEAFARRAAAMRSGTFPDAGDLSDDASATEPPEIGRITVDPCPSLDFNGADFLYFASFQAFVDRAEWQLFRDPARRLATTRREMVLRGNIEPGERLEVVVAGARSGPEGLAHRCRIHRAGESAPIAEIVTRKAAVRGGGGAVAPARRPGAQ